MAKKPSKRYRKAREVGGDLTRSYELKQAAEMLGKFTPAKFDETVEISANLGVDPRQSDQMVRGTVNLPHGSGKTVRVLVFTEKPQEALDAGADHAGMDDMIAKVLEGWADFDVAISTPSAMKSVRNVARVLGPRGLMPNPKSGTVCDDIAAGVKAVKAGRVEFKMDKQGCINVVVGKRSFDAHQINENAAAALDALLKARPEAVKGVYIKSLTMSSTMSPGIKIDSKEYMKAS